MTRNHSQLATPQVATVEIASGYFGSGLLDLSNGGGYCGCGYSVSVNSQPHQLLLSNPPLATLQPVCGYFATPLWLLCNPPLAILQPLSGYFALPLPPSQHSFEQIHLDQPSSGGARNCLFRFPLTLIDCSTADKFPMTTRSLNRNWSLLFILKQTLICIQFLNWPSNETILNETQLTGILSKLLIVEEV